MIRAIRRLVRWKRCSVEWHANREPGKAERPRPSRIREKGTAVTGRGEERYRNQWGAGRGERANVAGHTVRFSDKISNLKFHRNFTILGSKLIVLSAWCLRPSPPPPNTPRPLSPPSSSSSCPCKFTPYPADGEPELCKRNFENKQPITHYPSRLSVRLGGRFRAIFPVARKLGVRHTEACSGRKASARLSKRPSLAVSSSASSRSRQGCPLRFQGDLCTCCLAD